MKYKYVGILNEKIANRWNINEHKNKPILVFEDRKMHVIDRHLKDFKNLKNIDLAYDKLNIIIENPDYVYFNNKNRSLEYYKKIDINVCVVVRVNCGNVLKIKSWYPVNTIKIKNRKNKEYENKK